MTIAPHRHALKAGVAFLVVLTGCGRAADSATPSFGQATPMASTDAEPVGDAVPCSGLAGYPLSSRSYLPGAPTIERDGDQFALTLTVLAPTGDGSCRALAGTIVDIWHNGDQLDYATDRWRTALRSDATGTVRYLTKRPVQGDGPPHFHARVIATSGGNTYENEWTIAVPPAAASELTLTLLLTSIGAPPSTSSTTPITSGV